jgi:hypothetical protein
MDQRFAVAGTLCASCILIAAGLGCTQPALSPPAGPTASPVSTPAPATPTAQATAPPPEPTSPAPTPPAAGVPTVTVPPGAAAALAAVRLDLARRTSLAEAQITVTRAETVNWPDSALGCPQSGMMYLQVVTPGYRLVLTAGGVSTEYHTDASGRFVVCASTP